MGLSIKFKQGHRALVIGAGPIGLATIQWLRFFGARHIVVTEFRRKKKWLKRWGQL